MEHRPMGLGRLAQTDLVAVRKFRWTLEAEGLDECWAQKAKVDLYNKTLSVVFMDAAFDKFQAIEWLQNPTADLTLTTYDGCGKPLYQYIFHDISKFKEKIDFDYASSEMVLRRVQFKYAHHDFVSLLQPEPCKSGQVKTQQVDYLAAEARRNARKFPPKKGFDWTLQIVDGETKSESASVKISARPNLGIEEVELNFLNAKTWIPGKASWETLLVDLDEVEKRKILSYLTSNNKLKALLTMYARDSSEGLEVWELNNVQLYGLSYDAKTTELFTLTLRYDNVKYTSLIDSKKGTCCHVKG